tara:strand:- start:1293 stop:1664 length:372 start_codon:yes stop_codon:yes gene_type:complete
MKLETAKKLISNIKFGQTRNAARKNKGQGLTVKDIDLTPYDLIKKFQDQDGKCHWSGIALDESYNYITRHPLAISVDRLENNKGYTFDNVALTLRVFNLGKASYTGDFSEVVEIIKESWTCQQ